MGLRGGGRDVGIAVRGGRQGWWYGGRDGSIALRGTVGMVVSALDERVTYDWRNNKLLEKMLLNDCESDMMCSESESGW